MHVSPASPFALQARIWLCERLREGAAEEEKKMDEAVGASGDGSGTRGGGAPELSAFVGPPRDFPNLLRPSLNIQSTSPFPCPWAGLGDAERKAHAKAVARSLFRFGAAQALLADLGSYSRRVLVGFALLEFVPLRGLSLC